MFLLSSTEGFVHLVLQAQLLTYLEWRTGFHLSTLSQGISLLRLIFGRWGVEGKGSRDQVERQLWLYQWPTAEAQLTASLGMGKRWQTAAVVGKKRGRSETTEASLKGKQYRRISCLTLSNLYRENSSGVKVLTSFLWPLWAWLIYKLWLQIRGLPSYKNLKTSGNWMFKENPLKV